MTLERFRRSARAAARLAHPNLCPVYEVGEWQGVPFLVMPHLEMPSLADRLKVGVPFAPREAAELVRKLAAALQTAHRAGVIHRDLNPSNILLDPEGEPIVVDFGLALFVEAGASRLTQTGEVLGTPAYMAPEQLSGNLEAAGAGCDVFNLGVILYELLTGELPFGRTLQEVLPRIMTRDPAPPSSLRAEVGAELDRVCRKALAKQPQDRYADCQELADDLRRWLDGDPVRAPAAGRQVRRARNAHRWFLAACAAVVLGTALLLAEVVLRVKTPEGTVVLEVDQPDVEVSVNGRKIEVAVPGEKKPIEITVPAGEHELKVKKDGFQTVTRRFSYRKGEKPVIRVRMEPERGGKERPAEVLKPGDDKVDVKSVPPPEGALVLFDGKSLDNWTSRIGKAPAPWRLVEGGAVEVTRGDIITEQRFGGHFKLHVEFRVPYMPRAKGQGRGNSGVYLQGRYEVQVLDSYGLKSGDEDCGAIYGVAGPLVNACKAPAVWQSYDIDFTAARTNDGKVAEPARVSVWHNGVKIHNDVRINEDHTRGGMSSGELGGDPGTSGPILLQDNGSPVQYRNVWLLPLR
jgi:hypothetical protein